MEDSFLQAAFAMLAFMCGPEYNHGDVHTTTADIRLSCPDCESLLHDFLDEVLFMFSQGQVVVGMNQCSVGADTDGGWCMQASASIIPYDKKAHANGSEVKAVTWSNIKVGKRAPFDAYIILDI